MTHRKLWVLQAYIKIHKIGDHCQNIRQDFDIYRNIHHQKAKKLKKQTKVKHKPHKQTSDQTIKQTNKQRNKTNKQRRLFLFVPMQWLEPLRAAKRYKWKDNKQTITRTNTNSWTLHVETGPAPQIPKPSPGLRKWLLGLADPREGCVHLIWSFVMPKFSPIWKSACYAMPAPSGTRVWMSLTITWTLGST